MAIVTPVTENRQQLRPVDRTPLQPAEFSGGQIVARGVERLGRTIGEFAEQQNELNILHAQTAAQRARSEALRRVGEIRSRVTQTRLLDAETARQTGEREIRQIGREMGDSLGNPMARRMFTESFENAVQSDRLRMREHADQQLRVAQDAESEASIDLATTRAVDMRDNPDAVAVERGTIESNVRRRLSGAPEAVIQLGIQKALSNLHRATASAIVADDAVGGGIEAMEYLRQHGSEILPEHELSLFQLIQPQFDNDTIEAALGEVYALANSGQVSADPITPSEGEVATPAQVSGADYDPVRGAGRMSEDVPGHIRRSGRAAQDFAAREGTPIYPPMHGVVESAPREQQGANGHMVRIRHPNGMTTSFLHLRSPSPLREGQEVTTGTIIGSVGSTGRSTGPHVDFSVRDASGNAVDPRQVTWSGEALPLHTPQRHDMAALYRSAHQVARRLNLNSRQYEQLLSNIDRRVARDERLEQRAQDEVDRQGWERIAELGENLTNISQIPNFGQLSPNLRISIQNQIEQNTRAAEPEANTIAFMDANDLSYGSPTEQQEFLNLNIMALPITRAEQRALRQRQQQIRGEVREDLGDSNTAAQLGRIETAINRAIGNPDSQASEIRTGRQAGPADRRRYALLREAVRIRVEREQRIKGDRLTDVELQGAVNAELLEVSIRNQGGGVVETAPQYRARQRAEEIGRPEARLTIEIPNNVRQDIVDAFRRQRGRAPSDAEISYLYRRNLLRQ